MKLKTRSLNLKELGKKIKFARMNIGLTQKQLAKKVGLQKQHTISCYEHGTSTPSLETFTKLVKTLKMPSSYFMDDLINCETQETSTMKKINVLWFSGGNGCIGIVVIEDKLTKKTKAYMSDVLEYNEKADIEFIMQHGAKISVFALKYLIQQLNKERR